MGIRVMKEGRIFLYKEKNKSWAKKKKKADMVDFSLSNHLHADFCQPVLSGACTFETHVHLHTNINVSTYILRRDRADSIELFLPSQRTDCGYLP